MHVPLDTALAPTGGGAADPLPGWRLHRLDNGDWGSIYLGDPSVLPPELVGANITVQSRNGQPWTTTVTAVLERRVAPRLLLKYNIRTRS